MNVRRTTSSGTSGSFSGTQDFWSPKRCVSPSGSSTPPRLKKVLLFFTPSLDYMEISDKDGLPLAFSPPPTQKGWSREKLPSPSRRRSTTTRSTSVRSSWPSRPARSPPSGDGSLFASLLSSSFWSSTPFGRLCPPLPSELQDVTSRLELSDTLNHQMPPPRSFTPSSL